MTNIQGSKFTVEDKARIKETVLDNLRSAGGYTAACEAAGIDRVTFWLWRKDDPDLEAAIEEAKRSRVQMVEDSLYKKALEGNVIACIFYLKNKAGWKDVNQGGGIGDNNKIQVIITNDNGANVSSDTKQRISQENIIDGETKPLLIQHG